MDGSTELPSTESPPVLTIKTWFILGVLFHGTRDQFEDNFGGPSNDAAIRRFAKRNKVSYIKLVCTAQDFMKISRALYPD